MTETKKTILMLGAMQALLVAGSLAFNFVTGIEWPSIVGAIALGGLAVALGSIALAMWVVWWDARDE